MSKADHPFVLDGQEMSLPMCKAGAMHDQCMSHCLGILFFVFCLILRHTGCFQIDKFLDGIDFSLVKLLFFSKIFI